MRAALAASRAGRPSDWDALLIATAAEGGCRFVLSQDLVGGGRLGAVSIIDPFDGDRLSDEAHRVLAG